MASLIETSLNAGVLHIEFNRPDKRNALTLDMYDELTAAFARAQTDNDVRCVLLSGRGGAFTSGNDLGDFAASPPTGRDSPVFRFLLALTSLGKPLVAAVDGAAVGVGSTLLLHCDFVFAATSAKFQLPFVNLALCPEGGSTLLLAARCGALRANELLMLGEPFDAQAAMADRIVNKVVEKEALLETALATARKLCEKAPAALRATKMLLSLPLKEATQQALTAEGEAFVERLGSEEAKEAFTAFFERRKPDFSKF